MRKNIHLLFGLLILLLSACSQPEENSLAIIPAPQQVAMASGSIDISQGFRIELKDETLSPLKAIIEADHFMLYHQPFTNDDLVLTLGIDTDLEAEGYSLEVGEQITITGGSYQAVAMALSTLWQASDDHGKLPKMTVQDRPDYNYRSVMLDVARAWHSPETIKKIIDLCRWYKINYLHLHLTDDSAFSFPSDQFPKLATENHSYTKDQLVALNQYAYERGVILVPEIDVPGHSSQFIRKMPELFGIEKVSKNPYTVNMGKEAVYEALDVLMAEVASVFTHSPYIHIGGDEAFFEGMEDDPDIEAYMARHQLPNMHELFLHFLIRMNEIVKSKDKQTILWSGFGEHGDLKIPNDVIVLHWNHVYHDPQDLVDKKYPIINASFKPLYVVNNRKWEAQYIYEQWTPNRWESWAHEGDFLGEELPTNSQVMGATLCAWEQNQIHQMPRLRNRVASMAQRLWSEPTLSWEEFYDQQQQTNVRLSDLTQPFKVSLEGLTYPELKEGNFYEHLWFGKELRVKTEIGMPGITLQYTTSNESASGDWQAWPDDLVLSETTALHIRAIDATGKPVGRHYYNRFYYKPLQVSVEGLWKELPLNSWEKHRFEDTLWINLKTELPGHSIRYQTNGRAVNLESALFTEAFPVTSTTHLNAQLFNAENEPVGSSYRSSYFKIWNEPSLTTGKPATASNQKINPSAPALANNGRITLWEMWGDHVSEENWVKVDLEKVEEISRFKVYTFWDNYRYYQYTIEGSLNGEDWFEMVDFSENTALSTPQGAEHKIKPTKARYVKINMLFNSANPGLHLVEFGAFAD